MYERHWFSTKQARIFSRNENRYVEWDDEGYLAWKNEIRLIYTTETQYREVPIYNESGEQIGTETIEVQVQVPVMEDVPVYDAQGNQIGTESRQKQELVNPTIREVSCDRFILIVDGVPVENPNKATILANEEYAKTHPAPTPEERIAAMEALLLELTTS